MTISGPITLFDAHVHVYPHADVAGLLGAASNHFRSAAARIGASAWDGVLFLTEVAGTHWFERVAQSQGGLKFGPWTVAVVPDDPLSLGARGEAQSLRIVAGSQIVTAERIEVHALGTREQIADRMTLAATLQAVRDSGALAVLPWGVGKWLGRRGRLVASVLTAKSADVCASDNGGRPRFWRDALLAELRAAGRLILRGTDPLPLPGEEYRVGEFGSWFQPATPGPAAARALLAQIRDAGPRNISEYGGNESLRRFLHNQLALRVKRASAR